jgi:hypothetical protein
MPPYHSCAAGACTCDDLDSPNQPEHICAPEAWSHLPLLAVGSSDIESDLPDDPRY